MAQWAHDIRNALAVTGLQIEILERLAGSSGRKAATAAQAVMRRAADMCNGSLADARRIDHVAQRRGFDLVATIREIAAILAPIAPDGFEIRLPVETGCVVLADPSDVYRIIFNLVHNAIAAARRDARMSLVAVNLVRSGPTVAVHISDDGPGLPKSVRAKLFRPQGRSASGGLGISIARELAERNGGTLRLADAAKGTAYVFELASPHVAAFAARKGA